MKNGILVARASSPHSGWRSRGYLPHFDSPDTVQHVVWRLAGALPAAAVAEINLLPRAKRKFATDAALDQGHGERLLAFPVAAQIVEDSLLHFDGARYRLLAWCIMPTHVHVLASQIEGHPLSSVIHSWKSFTSKAINKSLARVGGLWAGEYHDRFMRDEAQLQAAREYIEANPVVAGLCVSTGEWRYSSAYEGRAGSPRYK